MTNEIYKGIELRIEGCHVCERHGGGTTMVMTDADHRKAYRAYTGEVVTGIEAHQCQATPDDLKPAIDEMLG